MLRWLFKFEDAMLHIMGPAQLGNAREERRRERARATQPVAPPHELVPGGFERRGTPGNYYIVRTGSQEQQPGSEHSPYI